MRLTQKSRFVLMLLTGIVLAGGMFAWMQRQGQVSLPSAEVSLESRLPDGIYSVLSEADTLGVADDVSPPHKVLAYDGRHAGEIRPVTYLTVGLQPYVPLVFESPPTMASAENGFASLHVTLESRYARGLERFTTEHDRVAVIVDGEVVTKHKVREPIRGGRFQITRCGDDACEVLYSKLID